MEQSPSPQFQAHAVLNPDAWQESRRAFDTGYWPHICLRLVSCGCILFLLFRLDLEPVRQGLLILFGLWAVTGIIQRFRNRDGGPAFQRLLAANNGNPPLITLTFVGSGIRLRNQETGTESIQSYSAIRSVIESQTLLILVLPQRKMLPIRKYSLQGGTQEEFICHLRSHCPSLKKRISRGRLGKAVKLLYICLLLAGAVLAVCSGRPGIQTRNPGSYQQAAQDLEALGITGSTPELLDELEGYYSDYVSHGYEVNRYLDLLCWLGMGEYDEETWDWSPSENGVYWFDAEMLNLDCMYRFSPWCLRPGPGQPGFQQYPGGCQQGKLGAWHRHPVRQLRLAGRKSHAAGGGKLRLV